MSEKELKGLVSLVTGATRGIGRAVAERLAGLGADVALVARDEGRLAETKAAIEARGVRAHAVACDLADADAAAGVVGDVVGALGRLDILVNNAGVTHQGAMEETATEVFDRLIAVNARAPFVICREAIRHLVRSQRGTVINICSVVSHKGYREQGAYAASKHALLGLTKVLAGELHEAGVRVHAISPGGVATEMIGQVRPDLDAGGLMSPNDIADLVAYLVTHRTNAMIDEIRVRRASSEPSF